MRSSIIARADIEIDKNAIVGSTLVNKNIPDYKNRSWCFMSDYKSKDISTNTALNLVYIIYENSQYD